MLCKLCSPVARQEHRGHRLQWILHCNVPDYVRRGNSLRGLLRHAGCLPIMGHSLCNVILVQPHHGLDKAYCNSVLHPAEDPPTIRSPYRCQQASSCRTRHNQTGIRACMRRTLTTWIHRVRALPHFVLGGPVPRHTRRSARPPPGPTLPTLPSLRRPCFLPVRPRVLIQPFRPVPFAN